MRQAMTMVLPAVMLCAVSLLGRARAEDEASRSGKRDGAGAEQALAVVKSILRGGEMSGDEIEKLSGAMVTFDTAGDERGVGLDRGVESGPGEGPEAPRNIYMFRFETGGDEERHLQVLRLQRELLKNQLSLLKSLTPIVRHQAKLGIRLAGVDNRMRDMTMGMKSSQREMVHVRGEVGSTAAKVTDIDRTTMAMAETLEEIEKSIDDLSGTLMDVDMMIGDMAGDIKDMK